jgi:leucine dehydrogenase
MGIKACVKEKFQTDSLKGVRLAVQGVGNVSRHLIELLHKEKAQMVITDTDKERLQKVADQYGCQVVAPEDIYKADVDIFTPCALGAVINDDTITQLKCKIVAGGANNQLKEPRHGDHLMELGILYAPDYVINAGGLMNVYVELEGYSRERALNMTKGIYYNLRKVFEIAQKDRVPTYKAADKVAEDRIETIGRLKRSHVGLSARGVFSTLKIENR